MSQTVTARSTPYRVRERHTRECQYCGISVKSKAATADYYCPVCRPLAQKLGWIGDTK